MYFKKILFLSCFLLACSPVPGPDKSIAGAALGGGLGAGSGAIIGNQVGMPGAGIAIGAGMAAAAGLASGIGLDLAEGSQLKAHRKLDDIKGINRHNLTRINELDARGRYQSSLENQPAFLQVFFDKQRASLKLASANQLQHLAQTLHGRRYGTYSVDIKGYSTDSDIHSENKEIVEARVASVISALVSNGVPENYIKDITETDSGRSPAEYDRSVEEGILLLDRSEPMNRYNNRVEVFVRY